MKLTLEVEIPWSDAERYWKARLVPPTCIAALARALDRERPPSYAEWAP